MFIIFNGRNAANILGDAQEEFLDEAGCLVITRDGDSLPPPDGLTAVPISEFRPDPAKTYLVIANGGTSSQSFPALKRLVESGAKFTAYDLQRDGVVQVW